MAKPRRNILELQPHAELVKKLKEEYDFHVYVDGSGPAFADPNNPTKHAFMIFEKKELVASHALVCDDGFTSTNKSEILAINSALECLLHLDLQNEKIVIFSDSSFAVNYAFKSKVVNSPASKGRKPYAMPQYQLSVLKKKFSNLKLFWIPRELNFQVDKLTR